MVSGMLYYAYIIQYLDRCDVAPSVAIVVLIRGGPRLQMVPVIGSDEIK